LRQTIALPLYRNGHAKSDTILLNKPFRKIELAEALASAMADTGFRAPA
jgi:hypothetical protein